MLQSLSVRQFAEQLATKNAQPNGGSAAALMGLTGVSLLHMVLAYCEEQEKDKGVIKNLQGQLSLLHADLLAYIDLDSQVFQELLGTMQLPQQTVAEQELKIRRYTEALNKAIDVPMKVASTCTLSLGLANQVLTLQLTAEASCEFIMAAQALKAGFNSALACVMSNLSDIEHQIIRQRVVMKATAEKKVAEHMIGNLEKFFQQDERFRLIYKV